MTTPRKASPAKASKAAAPRAKKPATKPARTAPVDNAVEAPTSAKAITLAGREIEVNKPTAEQILAWEESLHMIAKMEGAVVDFERMRIAVDHFYEVTGNLFVHDADREWMDTARRRGLVSIEHPDMLNAVSTVGELYKDELEEAAKANMNRAQKRAAARKKA
jgi:hypothetical protein